MYKLEHNKLPKLFNNYFVKTTNYHKYGTRQATSSNYFLPRIGKKKMHRSSYLLEPQNYGVQLNFKLKINNGIHLRNNILSPYLSLTLLKSYQKICKQIAIALVLITQLFARCNLGLFISRKDCFCIVITLLLIRLLIFALFLFFANYQYYGTVTAIASVIGSEMFFCVFFVFFCVFFVFFCFFVFFVFFVFVFLVCFCVFCVLCIFFYLFVFSSVFCVRFLS